MSGDVGSVMGAVRDALIYAPVGFGMLSALVIVVGRARRRTRR